MMLACLDKVFSDIVKETGSKVDIHKADWNKNEFVDFITTSIYAGSFSGMSKTKSNQVKEYIVKSIKMGYPISRIMKYVSRVGGKSVSLGSAETIANTEIHALKNKMREWSYKKLDPKDERKYKWLGPADHRETVACRNIKRRSVKGVSMKQLKQIIKEESRDMMGLDWDVRDWSPHPNCRHDVVRVV